MAPWFLVRRGFVRGAICLLRCALLAWPPRLLSICRTFMERRFPLSVFADIAGTWLPEPERNRDFNPRSSYETTHSSRAEVSYISLGLMFPKYIYIYVCMQLPRSFVQRRLLNMWFCIVHKFDYDDPVEQERHAFLRKIALCDCATTGRPGGDESGMYACNGSESPKKGLIFVKFFRSFSSHRMTR